MFDFKLYQIRSLKGEERIGGGVDFGGSRTGTPSQPLTGRRGSTLGLPTLMDFNGLTKTCDD